MKKKGIWIFLFLICLLGIFLFSSQSATESKAVSDAVANMFWEGKARVSQKPITEQEKAEFLKNTRIFFRKGAHFIIYFFLGILTFLTLKSEKGKHVYLFTILFCFLYACSDEIHQYFISERTAKMLDVVIDTIGSCLGVGFVFLIEYGKTKRKK